MNQKSTDTKSVSAEQQLTNRILVGLSSKRSDEEWEHLVNRTIEMFRQKNLFKKETSTPITKQIN